MRGGRGGNPPPLHDCRLSPLLLFQFRHQFLKVRPAPQRREFARLFEQGDIAKPGGDGFGQQLDSAVGVLPGAGGFFRVREIGGVTNQRDAARRVRGG